MPEDARSLAEVAFAELARRIGRDHYWNITTPEGSEAATTNDWPKHLIHLVGEPLVG